MHDLVVATMHQQLAKSLPARVRGQRRDLRCVVAVDERLDSLDGDLHRPRADKRREGAGRETRRPPHGQQTAAPHAR